MEHWRQRRRGPAILHNAVSRSLPGLLVQWGVCPPATPAGHPDVMVLYRSIVSRHEALVRHRQGANDLCGRDRSVPSRPLIPRVPPPGLTPCLLPSLSRSASPETSSSHCRSWPRGNGRDSYSRRHFPSSSSLRTNTTLYSSHRDPDPNTARVRLACLGGGTPPQRATPAVLPGDMQRRWDTVPCVACPPNRSEQPAGDKSPRLNRARLSVDTLVASAAAMPGGRGVSRHVA